MIIRYIKQSKVIWHQELSSGNNTLSHRIRTISVFAQKRIQRMSTLHGEARVWILFVSCSFCEEISNSMKRIVKGSPSVVLGSGEQIGFGLGPDVTCSVTSGNPPLYCRCDSTSHQKAFHTCTLTSESRFHYRNMKAAADDRSHMWMILSINLKKPL